MLQLHLRTINPSQISTYGTAYQKLPKQGTIISHIVLFARVLVKLYSLSAMRTGKVRRTKTIFLYRNLKNCGYNWGKKITMMFWLIILFHLILKLRHRKPKLNWLFWTVWKIKAIQQWIAIKTIIKNIIIQKSTNFHMMKC